MGVKGVKFEEVFDLDHMGTSAAQTHGLIFLFKFDKNHTKRPAAVYTPQNLFFAKQVRGGFGGGRREEEVF